MKVSKLDDKCIMGDISGANIPLTMEMIKEVSISYNKKFISIKTDLEEGKSTKWLAELGRGKINNLEHICELLDYVDRLKIEILREKGDSQLVSDIRQLEEGIESRKEEKERMIGKIESYLS